MLIKNVRFYEDLKIHDIYINDGIIECIDCPGKKDDLVFEGKGRLAIPPFVNPHTHLSYALTLRYGEPNRSGTLFEGVMKIRDEVAQKVYEEDVLERLRKIEKVFFVYGVLWTRSHDIFENDLIFKTIRARRSLKLIDLQIVSFPSPGYFYGDDRIEIAEKSLKDGADVVGLIPNNEPTKELGVKSVEISFDLAQKYGKMIDGHVDENDDPYSRFSETVVEEAYRRGMGELTTISHMTASHSYPSDYFNRLAYLMSAAKVNFVSNPIVSMHLQGRYDQYPKRRGVARIRDLMRSGVNVSLGTDNIVDAIYPLGDANMLRVLQEAFLVDHFTSEQVEGTIRLVTYNAAKTLGIKNYGIKPGKRADIVVLNAKNEFEAIRNALPPALVVRGKDVGENDIEFKINDVEITNDVENILGK
ncbi:amidohydrolase family protein [Acidianus sp. RZ1]|uniref:amidohydrolase family protein n=1 Tax=Acidianus sp. RZ1 TaxID=1540082 RepID=UPI001490B4EB|nr:amidohydrolase family protein [Acidianus sp. RZ1]NON62297.1 amidohydrolase family protein [Acidianus sp. RZ1]